MATAKAGESLRLRWTPNGHQRGAGQDPKTYTIHWTGTPNTQLTNRLDLNQGNQIVGATQFDEDCFCDNCAGNPCYGTMTIPANTKSGVYSFVWYWIFNRDPNGGGEEYTTCFDVNVIGASTPVTSSPVVTSSPIVTSANQVTVAATSENNQVSQVDTKAVIETSEVIYPSGTNCTSFCDSMCGVGQYRVCTCTTTQRTAICSGDESADARSVLIPLCSLILFVVHWI